MTNDVRVGDVWRDRGGGWEIEIVSLCDKKDFDGGDMFGFRYTNNPSSSYVSKRYVLGNGSLIKRRTNKHIKHYFGEL